MGKLKKVKKKPNKPGSLRQGNAEGLDEVI